MKRFWPWLVVGIVLVLVGLVWTLQGLDVLRGSAMSGSPLWGIVGPIVLIIGVVLLIYSFVLARRGRARRP
ncbi:hypothetical protein LK09_09395 [Microbacterium mangrovi]|uniref:Integral membrane protein n=1 Tax=Microbacterium mangrovi TaxID=1348253 RepID=A0A0B2A909_9MICO|nr:hypothetical protein [Microbacterium mangrovi]KHK98027.1 hypothetical protein LK09_09395 [Microbacterium mangrovi]